MKDKNITQKEIKELFKKIENFKIVPQFENTYQPPKSEIGIDIIISGPNSNFDK